MIDTETIKAIIIVALIALIATLLRRRAGFIIVLWAIALGFFIAAKIMKMEAMRFRPDLEGTAKGGAEVQSAGCGSPRRQLSF